MSEIDMGPPPSWEDTAANVARASMEHQERCSKCSPAIAFTCDDHARLMAQFERCRQQRKADERERTRQRTEARR